jgi:lysozyme
MTLLLPMTQSPEGIDFIKGWECCKLIAYPDGGGVWTIGWGETGPDVFEHLVWSQDYADSRLNLRLRKVTQLVNSWLRVPVTQQQYDALVSLAYNAGYAPTLYTLLNAGNYDAACEQIPHWNHDNGVVVDGLTRRRAGEVRIWTHGDYSARP